MHICSIRPTGSEFKTHPFPETQLGRIRCVWTTDKQIHTHTHIFSSSAAMVILYYCEWTLAYSTPKICSGKLAVVIAQKDFCADIWLVDWRKCILTWYQEISCTFSMCKTKHNILWNETTTVTGNKWFVKSQFATVGLATRVKNCKVPFCLTSTRWNNA